MLILYSKFAYSGPFSDFKAGAGLSEELSSSPTEEVHYITEKNWTVLYNQEMLLILRTLKCGMIYKMNY